MRPTIYLDTCHNSNIGGGENYLMRFGITLSKFADVYINQNFHQDFVKFNGFINTFKEYNWDFQPDIHIQCNYNFLTDKIGKKNVLVTFFPKEDLKPTKFDNIITICDYSAKYVKEYWNSDSSIIYPAIDESKYITDGIKKNQIISIGHFFQEADGHSKNQHILIEAFRKLDLPDWKLVLIGNVNSESDFAYAQGLFDDSLDLNVEFHFNATNDLVKEELSKSKILWHANGYERTNPAQTEHFGIIVLEALASGCRPIVHNSGGAKDIHFISYNTIDELVDLTKYYSFIQLSPNFQLERQYTLQGFEEGVESWLSTML